MTSLITLRRSLRRVCRLSILAAAATVVALVPAGATPPATAPAIAQPVPTAQGFAMACDGVWRPAPVDDPRVPIGPGLAAPSAVGLGEPFVAFLRHAEPVAATHWQLGLATTNTFGIETTSGPVPAAPAVLRLCLLITNPTAIGHTFSLSVGGEGPQLPPETVDWVPFRVTDPEPTAPCPAAFETVEHLRAPFVSGPVFNGQPNELYPGHRRLLMVVAGGMTSVEWELTSTVPDAEPPARSGRATLAPTGFVHALCLDGMPASWAGGTASLRLATDDESGVRRETRAIVWVGDPAAPCDGTPRPAEPSPSDPPGPSVSGPAQVALGAAARFRLVLGEGPPATSFSVSQPAPQVYAGIPTGGPLIGTGSTYEVCIRPLDPDAAGREFRMFLAGPAGPGASASFVVTEPPAAPS